MADSEIRQRKETAKANEDVTETKKQTTKESSQSAFSALDVARVVAGLFLLNMLLSYFITGKGVLWGYRPWWVRPQVLRQRFLVREFFFERFVRIVKRREID